MNWSGTEEGFASALKVLNIKLTKNLRKFRAHRIGPTYTDNDTGKKMQNIIVRFTTFRHTTLFYKNRKKIKSGARIRLDLTKDRYTLLVLARKRVDNCPEVNYVYMTSVAD